MSLKPWRTLARRLLFRTPRIAIHMETVELPDGRVIDDYEQYDMASFALVLALDVDGRVVCLRQYKHGMRHVCLTLPGGQINADEDPLAAAQRELLEETGHQADDWRALGCFRTHANQGGASVHYFLARHCRAVQPPDSGDLEEMQVETIAPGPFLDLVQGGDFPVVADMALVALALLQPDIHFKDTRHA